MPKQRIKLLWLIVSIFLISLLFLFAACNADIPSTDAGIGQNQQNSEETQIQSDDDSPDYEIVELNAKNYSEYLTIGIELVGSNIEYIGQNTLGMDRYVLSCVGNIRISKTGNYQFEKVTVLCGVTVQGWHDGMISANVELNYDGDGQYSFQLSKESLSNDFTLTSGDCNVSVYGAKGTVRIYE